MIGDLAAMILRFDGLVLETEEAEFSSVAAVFAEFGLTLTPERWGPTIGTCQAHGFWLDWLKADLGRPVDRHLYLIEQSQRHWEQMLRLGPNEGLLHLLDEAHRRETPVVLVSDSPSRWVRRQLERLDLTSMFHSIVTREAAPAPPPFPHLYLEALTRAGVPRTERQRVLTVEHSRDGVIGARRAGTRVALCPGRFNQLLPSGEPDLSFDSLTHFAGRWYDESAGSALAYA